MLRLFCVFLMLSLLPVSAKGENKNFEILVSAGTELTVPSREYLDHLQTRCKHTAGSLLKECVETLREMRLMQRGIKAVMDWYEDTDPNTLDEDDCSDLDESKWFSQLLEYKCEEFVTLFGQVK